MYALEVNEWMNWTNPTLGKQVWIPGAQVYSRWAILSPYLVPPTLKLYWALNRLSPSSSSTCNDLYWTWEWNLEGFVGRADTVHLCLILQQQKLCLKSEKGFCTKVWCSPKGSGDSLSLSTAPVEIEALSFPKITKMWEVQPSPFHNM